MSYSILRIERATSKTISAGHQRHNQREHKNYSNKDIDLSKSHLNYDLLNNENINYLNEIDEIIHKNKKSKRKVGKNQVQHMYGVITSDDEFFKDKSNEEIKQFFKDSLEFIQNKFGRNNVFYATVHMDEKIPHMHFGFVPITDDGRLSARDILNGRNEHIKLQDEFNKHCNDKGYLLKRGVSKNETQKNHTKTSDYKKQLAYEINQAQKEKELYGSELDYYKKAKENLRNRVENKDKVVEKIIAIDANVIKENNYIKMPQYDYYEMIELILDVHKYYMLDGLSAQNEYEKFKGKLTRRYKELEKIKEKNLNKSNGNDLSL